MAELSQQQAASREKTLLTALLLSAPGPLFTGYAAFSSGSTTQLADFIRRGMELVALFLSWWVFRELRRKAQDESAAARLERIAALSVAGAMSGSALVMLWIAWSRLGAYEARGNVTLGLVIAVLGLLTNGWFWRRYAALTREQYSAVIAAQQKLYRAKAFVDFCVSAALAAVALAPASPATRGVDLLGSVAVALYLLWSGLGMARPHLTHLARGWRKSDPGAKAASPAEKSSEL